MTDDRTSASLEDSEFTLLIDRSARILVIDDEEVIHRLFQVALDDEEYDLEFASTGESGLEKLEQETFNLLIIDKNLPGMSGIDVMRSARKIQPDVDFILITAYASYETAVEALRLGAFDYLEKPFNDVDMIKGKVDRALEKQQLAYENKVLAEHLRDAHRDLKATIETLDRSIGDVEKLSVVREAVEARNVRTLKIENTELRRAIMGMQDPMRNAYRKLQELAAAQPQISRDAEETRVYLQRAWDVAVSHVKKSQRTK